MEQEMSLRELHDRFIELFAQIKANEIINECNVQTPEVKEIILNACRVAMEEVYTSKYGSIE